MGSVGFGVLAIKQASQTYFIAFIFFDFFGKALALVSCTGWLSFKPLLMDADLFFDSSFASGPFSGPGFEPLGSDLVFDSFFAFGLLSGPGSGSFGSLGVHKIRGSRLSPMAHLRLQLSIPFSPQLLRCLHGPSHRPKKQNLSFCVASWWLSRKPQLF